MEKPNPKRSLSNHRISRRSFMAGVGAGTVCVAASSRLFASGGGEKEEEVINADSLSKLSLHINARDHHLLVEPRWSLLYVLREKLGLTGTKEGCSRGECGACTVLIGHVPRYACLTLALEAEGAEITTVEGLLNGEELGAVQTAFAEEDAFQCGYCTPGQIMSVEGLLRKNPSPTTEEIRIAVSGNLCRCGAYSHIFKAAEKAAKARSK